MPRGNRKKNRVHADDKANQEDDYLESIPSEVSFESMKGYENLTSDQSDKRIIDAIEKTMDKSGQSRIASLISINAVLIHTYVPDIVQNQKIILTNCIRKCIRRGKDIEKVWAARLAPLLMLQIGNDESIRKGLYDVMVNVIRDDAVLNITRSKFCTALGLMVYLGGSDVDEIFPLMQVYENIFSGSFLPDDENEKPNLIDSQLASLHAEALCSWGLMLTLLKPEDFVATTTGTGPYTLPPVKKFLGLLYSPHLAVRASTSLAIALILETGRRHDKDVFNDSMTELIATASHVLKGSHKYCIKLVRTVQRSTFTDLLKYLKEDMTPTIKIKNGNESFTLDTWYQNHRYSGLCSIAGPGMELHMKNNEFLRDLFEVGSGEGSNDKMKVKNSKARTIERNENRDKRRFILDDD